MNAMQLQGEVMAVYLFCAQCIDLGDEITVEYIAGPNLFLPVQVRTRFVCITFLVVRTALVIQTAFFLQARQDLLFHHWGFACQCARCVKEHDESNTQAARQMSSLRRWAPHVATLKNIVDEGGSHAGLHVEQSLQAVIDGKVCSIHSARP